MQLNNWTALPYAGSNVFPGVINVQMEAKTNANQATVCDMIKIVLGFIFLIVLAI